MTAPLDRSVAALHAFVRRLRSRVRLTRAAESLLAGSGAALLALIASIVATSARATATTTVGALAIGALVAAAILTWRRRDWSTERLVARAEATLPTLRNHLVTALELDRHPERASDRIRTHVVGRAADVVGTAPLDAVQPLKRATRCALGSIIVLLVFIRAATIELDLGHVFVNAPAATTRAATSSPGIAQLEIEVTPPAYSGLTGATLTNPERVDVLAGSRLGVRVTSGSEVSIALGEVAADASHESADVTRAVLAPVESTLLTITARRAGGDLVERRLVPLLVRADAKPEVTIDQPRKDLLFETTSGRVTIGVHATDDLGLATLALHYTKVTGSGEQYAFKEGELPLAVVRERATAWRGEVSRDLASLDLKDGDLLVYYASATDRRPGGERAVSDSYVIEVGKPNAAIAGGFAVPLEEDKAAISLSALIVKTQRTHDAKPKLAPDVFAGQTASLAVEQRMVRSETLFLMGAHGEVEDEEAEAEHSNEIQEGRLENRGQADLREATRLMSMAERSLLVADTGSALVSQKAALVAMQRALSKQRYFLRTLPVRSQIDLTRRLSGDLAGAQPWPRDPLSRESDARPAAARRLLRDVDAWANCGGGAPGASELAARLLALDPASTSLQAAARDLGRLGQCGDVSAPAARESLSRVVSALRTLMTDAPAAASAPPALSSGALRGAVADALRQPGGAR